MKTNKQYLDQLRDLRKYFNFSFDARYKMTPARKAAISRAENRYKADIKPALDAGGKFRKAPRGERRHIKELAGKKHTTPKGYILVPPKNAQSVKYDKKQKAIISRVGDFIFKQYELKDPVAFAKNPDAVLEKLPNYKNARFVRVNVGPGHHLGNNAFTKDQINRYITSDLPAPEPLYPDKKSHNPADFITGVTLVFLAPKKKTTKKGKK